jgi:hypothetical protein
MLPVTVVLSLIQLLEGGNIAGIGEPNLTLSDGNLSMSIPFRINNTGFYELSEVCIKIDVCGEAGKIAEFSTQQLKIPAGEMVESNLSASISLEDLLSRDRKLLTNDTELNASVAFHFRVAYVMAFKIAKNFTVHWGAPFSNLTIQHVGYKETHQVFSVSFCNNASFPISGPLRLEILNRSNIPVGSMEQQINVPSKGLYQGLFEILVSGLTNSGTVRLYFADILIREERWGSP